MQEVSGSIPLGSTSFADQGNVQGHLPAKLPKRQRRADLSPGQRHYLADGFPDMARPDCCGAPAQDGALAQLGERLHGMQEVSGSIPLSSTKFFWSTFALTCFIHC